MRVENQGAMGLSSAIQFKPDVILLDIVMPETDGSDVAMQLSENSMTRDIPIVFLTAIVEKEEVDGNDNMIGGRKFLAKPVNPAIDKVRRFVGYMTAYRGGKH